MNDELTKKMEAVLFFKGESVSKKYLSNLFKMPATDIQNILDDLAKKIESRGTRLVQTADNASLVTAPEYSNLMEDISKEELSRDIGKAGLETLSIILYESETTRANIDHLRGVSSSFILRNLMIRGLIEKTTNPKDQRSFLYKPTLDLLSHLGVSKIDDLPEYQKVIEEINQLKYSNAENSRSADKNMEKENGSH